MIDTPRLIAWTVITILAAFSGDVMAESVVERAHTAGDAHAFDTFTDDKIDETFSIAVPKETEQSGLTGSTIEDAAWQATIDPTQAAQHHGTISENFETWRDIDPNMDLLAPANEAVTSPQGVIGSGLFSSTGDALVCTTDSFKTAPAFQRTCDRIRHVYETTCTDAPSILIEVNQTFACVLESDAPGESCADIQVNAACKIANTVCEDFAGGVCLRTAHSFECTSPAPIVTQLDQIGSTTYSAPVVSWNRVCAPEYSASICQETGTSCESGASVEYVHGVAVPLECGSPVTSYQCLSDTYTTDCETFSTSDGCTLSGSTCLITNPDGQCGTYEDTYACGGDTETLPGDCEDINVCVEGVCQSVPNETNKDFPKAAAYVGLLNDMSKNWYETQDVTEDQCAWTYLPNSQGVYESNSGAEGYYAYICTPVVIEEGGQIEYFSGDVQTCRKFILAALNCCHDSGWANGVFGDCKESELVLLAANKAETTVYIKSYCSSKALFICLVKKRQFCVFGSKLGRVFNTEVQRVQGLEFECRPLTQDELETVDFAQIDLSPVYADMVATAEGPDPSVLSNALLDNVADTMPVIQENFQ